MEEQALVRNTNECLARRRVRTTSVGRPGGGEGRGTRRYCDPVGGSFKQSQVSRGSSPLCLWSVCRTCSSEPVDSTLGGVWRVVLKVVRTVHTIAWCSGSKMGTVTVLSADWVTARADGLPRFVLGNSVLH